MKIRYLAREEHGNSRRLYEEVFVEDEEQFVDAYYEIKAADNEILVAEDKELIVSMLHRNPYTFRFRKSLVEADYIVAVATKVVYRHQGWMRRLLTKALQDMEEQKKPFTFLMPADEAIYTPFDFRLMGNEDEESLARLSGEELAQEYELFVEKDEAYKQRHIFWTEWEATPMMIRIVCLPAFLEHIGAKEEQSMVLAIEDPILPENDGVFRWSMKEESSVLIPVREEPELRIAIADLGSFLCGMLGAGELPYIQEAANPGQTEEKLRKVKVLDSIYINETV